MIALIDGDIVCYRCAASAEQEPLEIALERADSLVERILYETKANAWKAFLTGSTNFRNDINPQYHANRKDKPKPKWLQELREHLVLGWQATISDGNEADDEMAIAQTNDTVICSIDKDLLQVPGKHYNFVKNEHYEISEHKGWQNFYFQMLMGDSSDNIFGFDGKARPKVPKFLEPKVEYLFSLKTPYEMYEYLYGLYEEHGSNHWKEDFEMNAHCLYLQRSIGDKWQPPEKPLDSNQG